jgi:hypothetical protein
MRLAGRYISRDEILGAAETYSVVEAYPDDKYLPSYLLLARPAGDPFHALFPPMLRATISESLLPIARTSTSGSRI